MARIRTIKPEFFLNEQLASVGAFARLLFIGLWTQADREGRMEDRPLRLKAAIFPYDNVDMDAELDALAHRGLIVRYAVDGRRLIVIPTWARHQQPHFKEKPSELPSPDPSCQSPVLAPDKPGASPSLAPVLPIGREGKGREGNDQEGVPITRSARAVGYTPDFEAFWMLYPRKAGKGAAWRAWNAIKAPRPSPEALQGALAWQRTQPGWLKDGGAFVPHASTWLNARRWEDEPFEVGPNLSARSLRVMQAITQPAPKLIGGGF